MKELYTISWEYNDERRNHSLYVMTKEESKNETAIKKAIAKDCLGNKDDYSDYDQELTEFMERIKLYLIIPVSGFIPVSGASTLDGTKYDVKEVKL